MKPSGFFVQATNPNNWLYSQIKYRATNKSLIDYPFLTTVSIGRGLIKVAEFEPPPPYTIKIEYVYFLQL